MYKTLIKPILFLFPPEFIHKVVFFKLKILFSIPLVKPLFSLFFKVDNPALKTTVFGIDFPNPVGLAAGFDKDAKLYKELAVFGFGFIEIGTVTPKAQSGNPKPRLFRLPKDNALINRMGFNNEGVEACAKRLKSRNKNLIIGGNIGKNKVTPNAEAIRDYEISFDTLYPYVDYFVVNVSSPNTPNLRELQDKKPLSELLQKLVELRKLKSKKLPILLKIAPDLTNSQLDDIIEIVNEIKIDGIIATNTTIDRSNLQTSENQLSKIGNGGLSGQAVKKKSTEIIKYLHQKSNGSFPIIGVGGIHSAADAKEKLDAGASLVQIYTGFIYEGPAIVKQINKELAKR